MRLILHIVGKDFQLLRGRLATWMLVLAAKCAVGFVFVFGSVSPDLEKGMAQGGVAGLIAFDIALTLLIASLLVHGDGLVGTTEFWRTRPISGARLLAAKCLGAIVLLGLPAVAISLPWWLVCGFGARDVALAAFEVMAIQVLLIAPAMAIASVTESTGRFFVWGGVTVAVVWMVSGVWVYSDKFALASNESRLVGELTAIAVTVIAVVVRQYLTRDVRGSRVMLVAGLVFSIAAARYWPWDFFPERGMEPKRSELDAAFVQDVRIEFDSSKVSVISRYTAGAMRQHLHFPYTVTGVPAGYSLGAGRATHRWSWAADPTVGRETWIYGTMDAPPALRSVLRVPEPVPDAETQAWWRKVERKRKEPDPSLDNPNAWRLTSGLRLPDSVVARLRETPPSYRVNLMVDVVRPTVMFELPAKPGDWQARDAHGVRVIEQSTRDFDLNFELIMSEPFSFLGELRKGPPLFRGGEPCAVVAVQRRTGYLVRSIRSPSPFLFVGGVMLSRRSLNMSPPRIVRAGAWQPQPSAWFDDLKLAVVALPVVGTLSREVTVDRFELSRR